MTFSFSQMMGSTLRVRQFDVAAFLRPVMLLLGACLAALLGSQAAFAADADDIGPHNLVITYRSDVRDRPAFREYLVGEGRAPFDKLVKDGALKDYQILFNTVNTNTWDAVVIMSFNRHVDTAKWTDLERTSPGGLTKKGLKLAKPTNTFSTDLVWQGSVPNAPTRGSVFYVIPYTYLTTLTEYKNYVDGYVVPQVQGWMKEGVLSSYRIYMNRFSVGMPWDALFVYQYKDLASFGARDATISKVRAVLKNDPNWQKLSDIKAKLRSETENTITEQLDPR